MGPGDSFVSLAGHDALIVERAGLPSLVYDFGWYSDAAIAPRHILGGTLRYFMNVAYLETTLGMYRREQRNVSAQVLSLDQSSAEKLADALSLNSLPKNLEYDYDFARDNCATRVRDHLDRALGGALRAQMRGPTAFTYRDHALRLNGDDFSLHFLFDVGLGKNADRPLDAWDDAYLPDRLALALRRIRISDARGTRPLVAREVVLLDAGRPPARERPPLRAPWHAVAGGGIGALLVALGRNASRAARVTLGLLSFAIGAVVGLLGLWILLLALTNVHSTSHDNYNLLVCPPWALGMVWGGLAVALGRASGFRTLARVAGQSAAIAAVGVVLALFFGQDSSRVALLVIPPLVGSWLAARAALRRGPGG
jgi:hypothetical protein